MQGGGKGKTDGRTAEFGTFTTEEKDTALERRIEEKEGTERERECWLCNMAFSCSLASLCCGIVEEY